MVEDRPSHRNDLLNGLARSEDNFRHMLPERPMVIHHGIFQLGKRQLLESEHRRAHFYSPVSNLFEQCEQRGFVHPGLVVRVLPAVDSHSGAVAPSQVG